MAKFEALSVRVQAICSDNCNVDEATACVAELNGHAEYSKDFYIPQIPELPGTYTPQLPVLPVARVVRLPRL